MSVKIDIQIGTPFLPAEAPIRLVGVLATIKVGKGSPLPLRLGIVVDKSESMLIPIVSQEVFERLQAEGKLRQGRRDGVGVWEILGAPPPELSQAPRAIDSVKEALRQIVERLGPNDQFFLVAFATQARTVIPLTASRERRAILSQLDQLERLELGRETRLAPALSEALRQVSSLDRAGIVDRWVILTDGFAEDESDCRVVVAKASEQGIGISTVGLGAQFNDDLMVSIADETGGNAEWAPTINEIPQVLAKEFEEVRKASLARAHLLLKVTQGVEIRRGWKVRPVVASLPFVSHGERTFAANLGDLGAGEEVQLLLELLAPPRKEGTFRLAQIALEWRDRYGQQTSQPVDIVVSYTTDPTRLAARSLEVLRAMEAVTAADLQTRALRDLQRGEVEGATRKLQAAATRLLNLGKDRQAQEVQQMAESLQRTGSAPSEETKKIRYQTRRLTPP
ncbi:MAG: VWA domain-containing protein [Armatimonadetes bacterium]|nr:VWA domain-containing protein [Armatimonadota bacterium]MDW8120718.1 VWA domain-containing protein [Armatimonadota bacterium]